MPYSAGFPNLPTQPFLPSLPSLVVPIPLSLQQLAKKAAQVMADFFELQIKIQRSVDSFPKFPMTYPLRQSAGNEGGEPPKKLPKLKEEKPEDANAQNMDTGADESKADEQPPMDTKPDGDTGRRSPADNDGEPLAKTNSLPGWQDRFLSCGIDPRNCRDRFAACAITPEGERALGEAALAALNEALQQQTLKGPVALMASSILATNSHPSDQNAAMNPSSQTVNPNEGFLAHHQQLLNQHEGELAQVKLALSALAQKEQELLNGLDGNSGSLDIEALLLGYELDKQDLNQRQKQIEGQIRYQQNAIKLLSQEGVKVVVYSDPAKDSGNEEKTTDKPTNAAASTNIQPVSSSDVVDPAAEKIKNLQIQLQNAMEEDKVWNDLNRRATELLEKMKQSVNGTPEYQQLDDEMKIVMSQINQLVKLKQEQAEKKQEPGSVSSAVATPVSQAISYPSEPFLSEFPFLDMSAIAFSFWLNSHSVHEAMAAIKKSPFLTPAQLQAVIAYCLRTNTHNSLFDLIQYYIANQIAIDQQSLVSLEPLLLYLFDSKRFNDANKILGLAKQIPSCYLNYLKILHQFIWATAQNSELSLSENLIGEFQGHFDGSCLLEWVAQTIASNEPIIANEALFNAALGKILSIPSILNQDPESFFISLLELLTKTSHLDSFLKFYESHIVHSSKLKIKILQFLISKQPHLFEKPFFKALYQKLDFLFETDGSGRPLLSLMSQILPLLIELSKCNQPELFQRLLSHSRLIHVWGLPSEVLEPILVTLSNEFQHEVIWSEWHDFILSNRLLDVDFSHAALGLSSQTPHQMLMSLPFDPSNPALEFLLVHSPNKFYAKFKNCPLSIAEKAGNWPLLLHLFKGANNSQKARMLRILSAKVILTLIKLQPDLFFTEQETIKLLQEWCCLKPNLLIELLSNLAEEQTNLIFLPEVIALAIKNILSFEEDKLLAQKILILLAKYAQKKPQEVFLAISKALELPMLIKLLSYVENRELLDFVGALLEEVPLDVILTENAGAQGSLLGTLVHDKQWEIIQRIFEKLPKQDHKRFMNHEIKGKSFFNICDTEGQHQLFVLYGTQDSAKEAEVADDDMIVSDLEAEADSNDGESVGDGDQSETFSASMADDGNED